MTQTAENERKYHHEIIEGKHLMGWAEQNFETTFIPGLVKPITYFARKLLKPSNTAKTNSQNSDIDWESAIWNAHTQSIINDFPPLQPSLSAQDVYYQKKGDANLIQDIHDSLEDIIVATGKSIQEGSRASEILTHDVTQVADVTLHHSSFGVYN